MMILTHCPGLKFLNQLEFSVGSQMLRYWVGGSVIGLLGGLLSAATAGADIIPDGTMGQERSHINRQLVRGQLTDMIGGGSLRGKALFHSFSQFDVLGQQRVYFANPQGVSHIFSRVTGNRRSEILGTLGVAGPASLLLLNPHGILFGANARLDVAGSFVASTSSQIRVGDQLSFSATHPQPVPLLRINLIPGLQYGRSLSGATITQRGRLSSGQDLVLLADRLDLQGQLRAGRNLTLQAQDMVRIRDTVAIPFLAQAGHDLTIQGDRGIDILALQHPGWPLQSQGNVRLISDGIISTDAHIQARGDFSMRTSHGRVANFRSWIDPVIQVGGNYTVGDYLGASLSVTAGGNITYGNVQITAIDPAVHPTNPAFFLNAGGTIVGTGNVVTSIPTNPLLIRFEATGDIQTGAMTTNGGNVQLTSRNGNIQTNGTVNTASFRSGDSGNIRLNANGLMTVGNLFSGTLGSGNGGQIALTSNTAILSANNQVLSGTLGSGRAGNIQFQAPTITLTNSRLISNTTSSGRGGDLSLSGQTVRLQQGTILSSGSGLGMMGNITGRGGDVSIVATNLLELSGETGTGENRFSTQVTSNTLESQGNAGNVTITAGRLRLRDGAVIASTVGTLARSNTGQLQVVNSDGDGGNVTINADDISISGISGDGLSPSRIATATLSRGNAGNVVIHTRRLIAEAGGLVATDSFTNATNAGRAGSLTVDASDAIELTGTSLDGQVPSALSASTFSNANSGDLNITTRQLTIRDGAAAAVSSFGNGRAGRMRVNADRVLLSGQASNGFPSGLYAQAFANGRAGGIQVNAGRLTLQKRATITVAAGNAVEARVPQGPPLLQRSGIIRISPTANGDAGNLSISADRLWLDRGKLLASTERSEGGNINLQVSQIVRMQSNSLISARAGTAQAGGNGGNITLRSPIILALPQQNSDIVANAFSGRGGQVNLTAQGIFWLEFRSRDDLIRRLGTTDPAALDPQRLPTNDVTASSQVNPLLNGLVTINTDPQPEPEVLPSIPVDPTTLIVERCHSQTQLTSSFVNSGRGGIPLGPDRMSPYDSVTNWIDTVLSDASKQDHSDAIVHIPATAYRPDQEIIEAQAVYQNDRGEIYLVALPDLPSAVRTPFNRSCQQ